MKKTVSILALLLLVGCESATKDTGHVSEDLDTEIDVDSSSWKTFEDEEIGIAFKYPGGKEAKLESELNGIDTGDKKEIATEDFTVTLTSEDYGMGISEGCCYYFPGKTVDLSQADESVKSVISKELGEVYNFERVSVDGKAAVHFLRVNSYIASSVVETLLIPYDHEIYSNIMISGSRSDFFESEEAIQEYIENFESNEVFEKFLASFEFLEIETTPEEASVKPVEVEYNNFTFSWPESWSVEEKMEYIQV